MNNIGHYTVDWHRTPGFGGGIMYPIADPKDAYRTVAEYCANTDQRPEDGAGEIQAHCGTCQDAGRFAVRHKRTRRILRYRVCAGCQGKPVQTIATLVLGV